MMGHEHPEKRPSALTANDRPPNYSATTVSMNMADYQVLKARSYQVKDLVEQVEALQDSHRGLERLQEENEELRETLRKKDTRLGVVRQMRDDRIAELKIALSRNREIGLQVATAQQGQLWLEQQATDMRDSYQKVVEELRAVRKAKGAGEWEAKYYKSQVEVKLLRGQYDNALSIMQTLQSHNVSREREVTIRYLREFADTIENLKDNEDLEFFGVEKCENHCDIGLHR